MAVWGSLAVRPLLITRRHLAEILPLVDRELSYWHHRAVAIPDQKLRHQAIASLTHKQFHCEGGCVFAAWSNEGKEALVRFIVAFQTISDYLDNLCDRTESLDPVDFRQLHLSMVDAVSPAEPMRGDYYRHHPNREDGGYLESLVATCRETLSSLPGFSKVSHDVHRFVSLYVDLQILKHIDHARRVPELERWFAERGGDHRELRWWEFAAASGSTLAIFALISDAARPEPVEAQAEMAKAYFPWICGLHILLDYLIDQEEDRCEGDLNFVSFYSNRAEMQTRIGWILDEAVRASRRLRDPHFHATVVEGLLGLYLSDPKVDAQGLEGVAGALLRRAGWRARIVYATCRRWRRAKGRLKTRQPGRGAKNA